MTGLLGPGKERCRKRSPGCICPGCGRYDDLSAGVRCCWHPVYGRLDGRCEVLSCPAFRKEDDESAAGMDHAQPDPDGALDMDAGTVFSGASLGGSSADGIL